MNLDHTGHKEGVNPAGLQWDTMTFLHLPANVQDFLTAKCDQHLK